MITSPSQPAPGPDAGMRAVLGQPRNTPSTGPNMRANTNANGVLSMRMKDWLSRKPCPVSFGRRGGGITSLQRDASSMFLISDTGATIEIPPAGSGMAGILDSDGRARLDAIQVAGMSRASAGSVDTATTLNVPATVRFLDLGRVGPQPAPYIRVAQEPSHTLKLRTADRFLPDTGEDPTHGGWWEFAPQGPIYLSMAGVVADGVTDNASALAAVRDFCTTKGRDRHWHWIFPEGICQYTANKWALGLTDLRLTGYGTTLQNVTDLPFSSDYFPLPREGIFRGNGFLQSSFPATLVVQAGQRFGTAAAGSTTIAMTAPADAALYAPGDRVFLHGFCTQVGGYSPNLRYFEWHEIAEVDAASGVITLERPLAYAYNGDWPDIYYRGAITTASFPALSAGEPETRFGKPRILKLNGRPQADGSLHHYPERLTIEGFRFAANPNASTSQRFTAQARNVVLRDLDLGTDATNGFFLDPREAENFVIERCRVSPLIELDKIVQHCAIRDCIVGGEPTSQASILNGTGVNTLEITGCTTARRVLVTARDGIHIRGNRIASLDLSNVVTRGPVEFVSGHWGGAYAEIAGNTYIKASAQAKVGESSFLREATIPAVDGDGNALVARIKDASGNDTDTPSLVRAMRPGVVVWLKSDPRVRGIVADVVDDGAGNFCVKWAASGNLKSRLVPGSVIEWHHMQAVRLDGTNPLDRFGVQTPNPGLLRWESLVLGSPWSANGVTLSDTGAGTIGNAAKWPGALLAGRAYRLTYDMTRTAGSVIIRTPAGTTNLATLSTTGTGLQASFVAQGSDFDLRTNAFNGSITPISLVEL
ncbi:hypothetical protein H0I76_01740 [Limibaculum sp. M0105]|uniref:Uncharacterized protein n=1 Tax=Thermohalobaculum xanthum TaxID=2753746 RepID=A0A8J7M462_9RHOB|nr:hypothetical protein [Thermohalobaculum xanthum]MBK0397898.1 hypothetical protein [Thermohalobaculum xanthum]